MICSTGSAGPQSSAWERSRFSGDSTMEVQSDFRDLLALFRKHDVDFILVGAYALAFHGVPRFTGDMDVFVRCDSDNGEKIIAALTDFGFGSLGLTAADFEKPEHVIQLGVAPIRIDLLTSISGVGWAEACAGREEGSYGDVPVAYLGRRELIANKRATGRKKDLADLEALGEE